MALTSTTVFDIIGGTQTITFNNPSQVDQITFSSNSITFQAEGAYSLIKTDLLLYLQFISVFNILLFTNFPSVSNSNNLLWPLSSFDITTNNTGLKKIIYNQTTKPAVTVLTITYTTTAASGAFVARGLL